jgi:7-keto-8-aminopelargonate synthetase-like enzyme
MPDSMGRVPFASIFQNETIVTPTTTLGHIAAIPVLVNKDDAIILDHQVHASVQMAVQLVKAKGVFTCMIRHNRLDMLAEQIKKLRKKYKRIWYMADGVYSMYGDAAPMEALTKLADEFEQLYLYVDDAHGISWPVKMVLAMH